MVGLQATDADEPRATGRTKTTGQRRPQPFVVFKDVESLSASFERRSAPRRSAPRRQEERAAVPALTAGVAAIGFRDLCHDLRQPVAALEALAACLEQEEGLSADGHERLDRLREEARRLSALVAQFLQPPPPVLVDLSVLARQASASVRTLVAPQVELALGLHAVVVGDPVLLSRVLVNLLQNAGEAASSHGRVRLTVVCTDARVVVTVEDTGDALGRTSSGHGLGLTIVQAVVASHRGRVECDRSALGGLRVQVHLPLALPQQEAP